MHKSYSLFLDKYPQRLCLPVRTGLGQRLVNLAVCVSKRMHECFGLYVYECMQTVCVTAHWDLADNES